MTEAASDPPRAFELRLYRVAPGRMAAYLDNYRDHRLRLFAKHGFTNLGFWTAADPARPNLFVMLVAHRTDDEIARAKAAYHADPGWKAEVDEWARSAGTVTTGLDSYVMRPADFSPTR